MFNWHAGILNWAFCIGYKTPTVGWWLAQDIRARGLKAQVSSMDDFDFEELPNQKIVARMDWWSR